MTLSYLNLIKVTFLTGTWLFSASGLDIVSNKILDHPGFQIRLIAQAQNYDENTLRNYAQALLEIEPLRQRALQDIQTVLNSQEVPSIACNRAQSYQDLPAEVQSLIVDYCNRSQNIVQQQGLTVSEFNNITTDVQSNPQLKQEVQAEMQELQ